MLTEEFDFDLPPELIAQKPAERRDESRLLVFRRGGGEVEHRRFLDLPDLLRPTDLLVLNNSKVIPARMRGMKESGGAIEFLLLEEVAGNDWWTMLRPAKRLRPGDWFSVVDFAGGRLAARAQLVEKDADGHCRLRFEGTANILEVARVGGEAPLPPYIQRGKGRTAPEDLERYQTVYAAKEGSVAAPTAGLHFTPAIFERLRERGVETAFVTLHVGAGTFAPVKAERVEDHRMHEERFEIPEETREKIEATKAQGGRVVCVGTTSLRVLESDARREGRERVGRTRIYIYPPFEFRVADGLLTNFHLPKSTLLMLVSAFAAPGGLEGRERVLGAYRAAVGERYRFFSYGDAMLITD